MRAPLTRWIGWTAPVLVGVLLCTGQPCALAEEPPAQTTTRTVSAADEAGEYAYDQVFIEEKLGAIVPEGIKFFDEDGNEVEFRDLVDRPTALLLVYLRCPNVCSPLMREVAHTVEEVEREVLGKTFRMVTVSFDARETPELAKTGKVNLLKGMKKEVDASGWHFLTGTGANIRKLCDAVGFYFKRNQQDYDHDSAVIFLTKEGKIVRYLKHSKQRRKDNPNEYDPAIMPADFEMAVSDARTGTERTLVDSVNNICYAYDPESRRYVFQINRIILIVTLLGVGIFLAVLLLKRNKTPASADPASSDSDDAGADDANSGGHA